MILPTNIGEKFAKRVLKKLYAQSIIPLVTNNDYEGEITGGGADRLTILSFLKDVTLGDYVAGTEMSVQREMDDTEDQLIVDQQKYFNVEIDNLNKFEAYVNDLDSTIVENKAQVLQDTIEAYILDLFTEVKAGHRVGSDYNTTAYATSTAAVTAITGAMTITDPGISSLHIGGALVGLGISFDSGVTWYKIKTYTDSSTLVIDDWNDSAYTGGTKTAVDFIIEAIYPKTVSKTTIYADILSLSTALSKDKIPQGDRWLTVPPDIANLLKQATELIPAVATAYEDVVKQGLIGTVGGFKVIENVNISGNGTNGWHCLAGHKAFITFANAYTESRVVEPVGNFGKRYQGLDVYGAKVTKERRKAGADGFWIISGRGDDWKA